MLTIRNIHKIDNMEWETKGGNGVVTKCKARVKEEESRINNGNDFEAQAKEYAFLKKQADYFEKQICYASSVTPDFFEKLSTVQKIDKNGIPIEPIECVRYRCSNNHTTLCTPCKITFT